MRTSKLKNHAGRVAALAAAMALLPVFPAADTAPPQKIATPLSLVNRETPDAGDRVAGNFLYTKRDAVEITAESTRSSAVVATLTKGTRLEMLEQRGAQLRIRTPDGKTGWISKLNTTETKPRESLGTARVLRTDDIGPGERSNVSAVRGLKDIAQEYALENKTPQQAVDDVKKMEAIGSAISDAEVEAFKKEGGLEQ